MIEFNLDFDFSHSYQSPFTVINLHQNQEGDVNKPLLSFDIDDKANPGSIMGTGENSIMDFKPKKVNLYSRSLHQTNTESQYPLEV